MFPPGDSAVQKQRTQMDQRRGMMGQGQGPGMMGGKPMMGRGQMGGGQGLTPRGPMPGMGAPQGLGAGVPPQRAAIMARRGGPPIDAPIQGAPQFQGAQGRGAPPALYQAPMQPPPQWNMPESTYSDQVQPVTQGNLGDAAGRAAMQQMLLARSGGAY